VLHTTDYLRLPRRLDPLSRAQGWDDYARHVQDARVKYRSNLLIGHHYSEASLMSFYLPDQPQTFLLPEGYGESQFSLWPEYRKDTNTRALFVCYADPDPPWGMIAEFPNVKLVDQFWSLHKGRPMNEFQIYLGTFDPPTSSPSVGSFSKITLKPGYRKAAPAAQNPRLARRNKTAPTAWKRKLGIQTSNCGASSARACKDWARMMKL